MREAFEKDETIQNTDGSYEYITMSNDSTIIEAKIVENNESASQDIKQVSLNEL